MNYRVLFVGTMLTLLFLFIQLPELALVVFVATLFGTVYTYAKWKKKKVWEEVKKADATHPSGKMESYAKIASKQTAEFVFPEENKQYDYKGVLHKTPQLAKNFFTELKELFK
ncbi:MAG: hypothetical protein ACOX1V_02230 [Candidatus Iainarchaeum sp.]|jgi:flagellar biosynthesis component FlhA